MLDSAAGSGYSGAMSTAEIIAVVIGSAVLSSLLTTGLLLLLGRIVVQRRLEARFERAGETAGARVRAGLAEAAEELLPRLRAEVKDGFTEAAEEVLPRLREEVEAGVRNAAHEAVPELRSGVAGGVRDGADEVLPRVRQEVGEGVREALLTTIGSKVIGKAGEQLTRTGTSVLEAGLAFLFGDDDGKE